MTGTIADHLWQSTLCAAGAAALTLVLRKNRAEVRYAIWLAASLKFLVPFAWLVALGQQLGWARPSVPLDLAMQRFAIQPAARPLVAPAAPGDLQGSVPLASDAVAGLLAVLPSLWLIGTIALVTAWSVQYLRVRRVVGAAAPLAEPRVRAALDRCDARIRVVESDILREPCVFGMARPTLVWPQAITPHLTDQQVEAIVAHELCHVARRDNLGALLHAAVQAIFWFHPMVWWIGARLLDERERACDEAVLRRGSRPDVYAESILRTCQLSLGRSPLGVAGVTGSDLKGRIARIVQDEPAAPLRAWQRALVRGAAFLAVAGPIALGVVMGPRVIAQAPVPRLDAPVSFEVASVKPNTSGSAAIRIGLPANGRITITNMPLRELIRFAYQVQPFQLVGGPGWIDSERYDVNAKMEETGEPPSADRTSAMMRSLLAERFNLSVRRETREMPLYALVLARADRRLGEKLRPAGPDCAPVAARSGMPAPPPPAAAVGAFRRGGDPLGGGCQAIVGPGFITSRHTTMEQLARTLASQVRRVVVDRTGLTGFYDVDLEFTPEFRPQPPPGAPPVPEPPADAPSIYTAVQEQLGLELESTRGPVDVVVIDRVDALIPD